jgi:MoaA/NifB/PqqE/SkfB family radical SAM enzyme
MKREDELTLDEWDRSLRSVGQSPIWITLSGGEPFLYRGIVELACLAYDHCRPAIINIPTNSLMHKRIPNAVRRIVEHCRGTQIVINLSLDGVGEQHDHIRRVPGNFAKFEANYAALKEMTQAYPSLSIGIHTVISTYNVDAVIPIYDYALSRDPDSYITEIAEERVELDTIGAGITPALEQYARAIDPLIDRMERHSFHRVGRLTQAFRLEYYQLVKRILAERRQVIDCYAGWASAHIYGDGSVWPCCVRAEPMGNLREVNHDFKRVWHSRQGDLLRKSIANKECACPLANAAYTNMLMDVPTLMRVAHRLLSYPARAEPGAASVPVQSIA